MKRENINSMSIKQISYKKFEDSDVRKVVSEKGLSKYLQTFAMGVKYFKIMSLILGTVYMNGFFMAMKLMDYFFRKNINSQSNHQKNRNEFSFRVVH